jgi:hypothetical protein
LSALRTWIWDYLPVVSEGLACSKVANDGGYESYSEEDVQEAEKTLVRSLPD